MEKREARKRLKVKIIHQTISYKFKKTASTRQWIPPMKEILQMCKDRYIALQVQTNLIFCLPLPFSSIPQGQKEPVQ